MIKAMDNGNSPHEVIRQNGNNLAVRELAPFSDWSEMHEPEHFVQLYETDEFLLKSLGEYVGAGLRTGDACIVVATKERRSGLEEHLRASGLNVEALRASGQFVSLDAGETLTKFMVDGQPDAARFSKIVGRLIKQTATLQPRLRIFGEMVALLWAEGRCEAAIRLEELWNNLRETHPFWLFCAYPIQGFGGEAHATPLSHMCSTHSRVIPAESYTTLATADDRLRAIIQLQQKARSLQAEIAERKEAEDALLAVKNELEQELKAREQLLAREQMARAEAESANRLKDEFLATVSHELRTPLNAILGWTHMLRSGELDAPGASHALATIERNAKAQAQLVEDILDVSRVITGKLSLNIAPVDMASVINAAIDSVQLAADSKGIQLEVRLDPSARHVSGDAGRLQQVVWNLLSNAIKFTPSGGRVEVRLERTDSQAQIMVSDTGQGIRPDFLPFIFDRFRQGDASSTRRHGGLGLGLAIVRHLIELHGGTVFADSPGEGRGATFTLRLPLAPASGRTKRRRRAAASLWSETSADATLKPRTSLEDTRVLLVDDDRDTLGMLVVMLTAHGAVVQTASSADDALDILRWFKPDVLVSDLAMPGEDGYSLIGKVRATGGKQIPAVALTAYVRVEDRTRALSAGFNMFVPKPVEPKELIAAIVNLTEVNSAKLART